MTTKAVKLRVYRNGEKYAFRFDNDKERTGPYKESLLIALAKFHFSPKKDIISPNCREVLLECDLPKEDWLFESVIETMVYGYNNWVKKLRAAKEDIYLHEQKERESLKNDLELLTQRHPCCEFDKEGLGVHYHPPKRKVDNVEMKYPGNGM